MEVDTTRLQYENENSLRKYPISEDSTCLDDEGRPFPSDIITDMCVVTFKESSSVRLGYVHIGQKILSIVIYDGDVAVATLTEKDYSEHAEYIMASGAGIVARVSVGSLYKYAGSTFKFSTDKQAKIHEFCVIEMPSPVVERFVDDKSGKSFTGDVSFEFSGGVSAQVDNDGKIVVRASDATEKILSGGCTPTDLNKSCIAPVIQTINGVAPNSFGEIALVFE